jgi:tetratricopeptide (TPR) repeat protein
MHKKYIFILIFSFCILLTLIANEDLIDGIEFYQNEMYNEAISSFHNIILDPANASIHADAYFWLAKSYFILNRLDDTERNLEFYLVNFETHKYYEDAVYLKGRLLFKQKEYDSAIIIFKNYIDLYPNSDLISHCYFWIGESLFLLGNMDSAKDIFQIVINEYPQSVKYEAANYRLSLIDIKRRENELLLLLKISHEEYLETLEEYQRLIQTYEQAISAYQKQLSGKLEVSQSVTSDELMAQKEAEIAQLKAQIEDLENKLASSDASVLETAVTDIKDTSSQSRLLNAKQEALVLKDFLLDYLNN